MRWLLGMEHSGVIREAMRSRGVDAWSCDFLPADDGSEYHVQGDVFDELKTGAYDAGIFHPTCTYLTCSAEKYYDDDIGEKLKMRPGVLIGADRRLARNEAVIEFIELERLAEKYLLAHAIENPVGVISSRWRKPDMTVQPYQFGDDASKRTCFWTRNLPNLRGTNFVQPKILSNGAKRWANQAPGGSSKQSPGPNRWKERSKTFHGIADAIADQWGVWLETAQIQQELFS